MIKYKKKWYGHFLFFFLREKLKCKLTHSSFRDFETGPAKTLTFSFTSGADLKWKILLMEDCFDFHFPIIHCNGLDVETDLQFKWNLVKEHYAFRIFCSMVPHLKKTSQKKKLREHVLSLQVLKDVHWHFSQGQGVNYIRQWRQCYRCQDMLWDVLYYHSLTVIKCTYICRKLHKHLLHLAHSNNHSFHFHTVKLTLFYPYFYIFFCTGVFPFMSDGESWIFLVTWSKRKF